MRVLALCVPVIAVAFSTGVARGQSEDPAASPKVVVAAAKGRGAPNLKSAIRKQVEKRLKSHATLVPFKAYKKAGRKAKIKGKKLTSVSGATTAGQAAGATHVLIVESQMRKEKVGNKKRKKKVFYALVQLVDVGTGEVSLTQEFALQGRKLSAEIGGEMVQAVADKLRPAEPPAPEEVPEEGTGELEGGEPPASPPAPPMLSEGTAPGELAPEAALFPGEPGGDALPVASEMEMPPAAQPEGELVASAESAPSTDPTWDSGEPSVFAGLESADSVSPKKRPALNVRLGGFGFLRRSDVKDKSATDPLSYGGDPLPAGLLQFEFFPLALDGDGAIYEGIGLYGDGWYTQVKTLINETTQETVTSQVMGANGGLTFRFVFWDSVTAPDIRVNLGTSYFRFPLSGSAFPGVQHLSATFGLQVDAPLGLEMVVLTVGGHGALPLQTAGGTNSLGDKRTGGFGFRADGGVKLVLAPVEVMLGGRYESMSLRFSGSTALKGVTQYTEASLLDSTFGGYLTVGVVLW